MGWKESIQAMLDDLVSEMELPENSLYLRTNYGRDREKITSYSVCIYEPEYPVSTNTNKDLSRNSTVLNIKEVANTLELIIGTNQFKDIETPKDVEVKRLKSDLINMHVLMASDSEELVPYIQKNVKYALDNYTSKTSSFACCSRVEACSDAKHCVHDNKLYSKACTYRGNLDTGKIFYGENRNVN